MEERDSRIGLRASLAAIEERKRKKNKKGRPGFEWRFGEMGRAEAEI